MSLNIHTLSLPVLFGIFAGAGLLVWFAGTKLTGFVNSIAEATGIGKARDALVASLPFPRWRR